MRGTGLVLLSGLLAGAAPARGDLWTNQAGRVVEARLEAFDGAWVTLVRTNGSQLKLPLGALCPADQRRVRLQTGQSVAPAFVQAAYRDAKAVLEKFDRLPAERRTEEARVASIGLACAAFDARLKPRLGELKEPGVSNEVRRLRALLQGQ